MIESSFILDISQREDLQPASVVKLFPKLHKILELSEINCLSMYSVGKNPYYDDSDYSNESVSAADISNIEVDDEFNAVSVISTIPEESWVCKQFSDFFPIYSNGDEYILHSLQFCIAKSLVEIQDSYDESYPLCKTMAYISFAGDGSIRRRIEFFSRFADSDLAARMATQISSVFGTEASWAGIYQT